MMITLENLKNNLFCPDFFTECADGNVTVKEKFNRKKPNTLKQVTLQTSGTLTRLSHDYLDKSSSVYRGNQTAMCLKNCDGTFIVTKDGRQYLVMIEMKSSYAPKSLAQIIGTRIRFKAMLMTMASYYDTPLEEVGIVVSYPITINKYDSADSSSIMQMKENMAQSSGIAKYDYLLEKDGESVVNIDDFKQLGTLDINNELRKALKIKHIKIDYGQETASVDLDKLLI